MLCFRCGRENGPRNEFCIDCGTVLKRPSAMGGGGRSTGLPQTTSALLSYLGWWITGLIFYFLESDRFVRFHALQSTYTFGGISLLLLLLSLLRRLLRLLLLRSGSALAETLFSLLGVLTPLVCIGALLLWVVLIVKASQGETYKLPLAGDLAERQPRKK